MKKRLLSLFLLICLALLELSACAPGGPSVKRYYEYFNTESVVTVWDAGEGNTDGEVFDTVRSILGEYHKLLDIYYEYSGMNNLATVNRLAGTEAVEVDGRLIDFLLYAKDMHTLTGGEMNIALGAVTRMWHDCREAAALDPSAARIPSRADLIAAAAHTDIADLVIDRSASTVSFADSRLRLDVGALGKGYATELVRRALIEMGVVSCTLNIGGNIAIIGKKPDGSDFLTGITNPKKGIKGEDAIITTIPLSDLSCVTSGDYERYYCVGNIRYHHVIDPDTLMPAVHFASVTVICEDGGLCDALSTALFCMTETEGRALLDALSEIYDIRVLWIDADNNISRYGF